MTNVFKRSFVSSLFLLSSFSSFSQEQHQQLSGPYLGQTPPGMTAKVFAPGYVSIDNRDFSGSFTPDMTEFYFTRKENGVNKWWLMRFKLENNQWTESVVGPRVGRPIVSHDGKIMYLGKKYRTLTKNGWSEIKSIGPMIDKKDYGIMRLTSSNKGTYVFDDAKNNDVLRFSTIKNGKRQSPELFPPHINSGKWTAHPFIAQDESYLIWDSEREEGHGDSDLYVSFKQKDGSWGEAINLGAEVNSEGAELGGYVSPDGKYLFFNRMPKEFKDSDGDIYWVSAEVLYKLKPKAL